MYTNIVKMDAQGVPGRPQDAQGVGWGLGYGERAELHDRSPCIFLCFSHFWLPGGHVAYRGPSRLPGGHPGAFLGPPGHVRARFPSRTAVPRNRAFLLCLVLRILEQYRGLLQR